MKKEREKEIINSYKEKKVTGGYIIELARMQFDFIGVKISKEEYIKNFKELHKKYSFTKESYNEYKLSVFKKLVSDFGYPLSKCELEFKYFYFNYGLKIK